jgi:phosphoglycolate phosphatase
MLFDFDGTIADTLFSSIKTAREISDKFKLLDASEINIEKFRNLSSEDFIKRLDINPLKLLYIIWLFRRKVFSYIEKEKPIDGMLDTLNEIQNRGVKIAIVSSNTKKNINKFLHANGFSADIEVFTPIFIMNKTRQIKKACRRYGVLPENTAYVGDETRDIISAKDAGVMSVSVTWGFQFREVLSRFGCDFMADTPSDLLKLF